MKPTGKLCLCLLLGLTFFACKKNDVIFYNDVSFITAQEGVYYSDAGLEYRIAENATGKEIPAEGRFVFASDILRKVSERVYEIRLNAFSVPLTKDAVASGEAPEAEDPIRLDKGWFAGGYFNILAGLFLREDSEVKHILNVEYTLPTESNDTLYLHVLHDAQGEFPAVPDEPGDYRYVTTYACFHVAGLLPEGTEAPVKISWKWYEEAYDYKMMLRF